MLTVSGLHNLDFVLHPTIFNFKIMKYVKYEYRLAGNLREKKPTTDCTENYYLLKFTDNICNKQH